MTGPATLTAQQIAVVRTYATSAAMAYHDTQVLAENRVDLPTSFLVHGDLKLVAADVLEAACLKASTAAAGGSGGIKRVKIEGEIEVEKFASTSVDSVTATSWCALAARLRAEVQLASAGAGRIVRSPLAGMRTGSNPNPVFCITRPPGSEDQL